MRWPSATALLWAAMLGVLAAVLWAVFAEVDYLSVLMPAFAVAGTAAIALLSAWRGRTPRAEPTGEPDPDLSLSAPTAAVGVALVLVGLEVGTFLVFAGAGLALLGGGGLVREWRAQRRA